MPGETTGHAPAGVVLMSAEDGLADTIRPRLDAAEADTTRVVALVAIVAVDGIERLPTPARRPCPARGRHRRGTCRARRRGCPDGLPVGRRQRTSGPEMSAVPSHRSPRWRKRHGAAILVLRHLNKSTGGPAVYRGGGSIGIVGAARSALVVGVDPDDETRNVLAVTKANLAPLAPSLAYRIVDRDGAGAIEWQGTTDHTASQLLAAPTSEEDRSASGDAKAFLRDLLAGGPVLAKGRSAAGARVRDIVPDARPRQGSRRHPVGPAGADLRARGHGPSRTYYAKKRRTPPLKAMAMYGAMWRSTRMSGSPSSTS